MKFSKRSAIIALLLFGATTFHFAYSACNNCFTTNQGWQSVDSCFLGTEGDPCSGEFCRDYANDKCCACQASGQQGATVCNEQDTSKATKLFKNGTCSTTFCTACCPGTSTCQGGTFCGDGPSVLTFDDFTTGVPCNA